MLTEKYIWWWEYESIIMRVLCMSYIGNQIPVVATFEAFVWFHYFTTWYFLKIRSNFLRCPTETRVYPFVVYARPHFPNIFRVRLDRSLGLCPCAKWGQLEFPEKVARQVMCLSHMFCLFLDCTDLLVFLSTRSKILFARLYFEHKIALIIVHLTSTVLLHDYACKHMCYYIYSYKVSNRVRMWI